MPLENEQLDSLGPWIFATAVFLVLSYLLIFIPRARRIVGLSILAIVVAGVGIAAFFIIQQQRSDAEYAEKSERAKTLTTDSDVIISGTQMNIWGSLSTKYGGVSGTITSKSQFALDRVEISVSI